MDHQPVRLLTYNGNKAEASSSLYNVVIQDVYTCFQGWGASDGELLWPLWMNEAPFSQPVEKWLPEGSESVMGGGGAAPDKRG